MWGPYLGHKRILMIDKQTEHAADYFNILYTLITLVAHLYSDDSLPRAKQNTR